jgi:hypothetical protein
MSKRIPLLMFPSDDVEPGPGATGSGLVMQRLREATK